MESTELTNAAQAQAVLDAQPFSRLMGTVATRFESGTVEFATPLDADRLQHHGFVHGGVLAYAADIALAFAGGSVLGSSIVTRGFSIDYLRPAGGRSLRAVGTVLSRTARQALCRCEVYAVAEDGAEKLCVAAQGTIAAIEPRP